MCNHISVYSILGSAADGWIDSRIFQIDLLRDILRRLFDFVRSNMRAARCAFFVPDDVMRNVMDVLGVRLEEDVVREERESHAHETTQQSLFDHSTYLS